jgi:hypothetical protein
MTIILLLGVLAVLALITAVVGSQGLWHSLITFFNVLVAALIATNYFEPISEWLDYNGPTFTYLIDFLVVWGLFAGVFMVLRTLTDLFSRVKVRFIKPVDMAGGFLMSFWTGWVFVCFAMMTLHTTALPRNFLGGAFQPTPESRMVLGLAPDRQWLALVHRLSKESLRPLGDKDRTFDPKGEFVLRYGARRAEFETVPGIRVNREWGQPARRDAVAE